MKKVFFAAVLLASMCVSAIAGLNKPVVVIKPVADEKTTTTVQTQAPQPKTPTTPGIEYLRLKDGTLIIIRH